MNAVKDTEKEVDPQRIAMGVGIHPHNVPGEPEILKADLSREEWMESQPRLSETTSLGAGVSKLGILPVMRKRKLDDCVDKVEKRAATGSLFLQPLAGNRETGIDTNEPEQAQVVTERIEMDSSKKARIASDDEPPKKIVELDLNVESDGDEILLPGEEGTRVITEKDVLCGRGGAVNAHRGNKVFRDIIDQHRRTYLASRKIVKPRMNRAVVKLIRQEGGRFLKCDESDGLWYEIGDYKAHEKVGQAFRQRAPEMRKLFFNEEHPVNSKERKEQVRQALHQQQQQQLEELQQQQQKHLQEIQKQQQRQEELQMALIRAGIGTAHVMDSSTLALISPFLLQQAITNPAFYSLLSTNQFMAPSVTPFVNPALQTLVPNGSNTPGVFNLVAAAAMGNGGFILPKPNDPTNPAVASTNATAGTVLGSLSEQEGS